MAPKKTANGHQDFPDSEHNGSNFEQKQKDHELFLQAFEKPTQIYRYLKMRSTLSPSYLNRNLHYMKYGMTKKKSKSKKKVQDKRKEFKIDFILDEKTKKQKALEEENSAPSVRRYMTLTFLGVYDIYDKKKASTPDDQVKLEVLLIEVSNKNHADKNQIQQNPTRVVKFQSSAEGCPVNPNEDNPPQKAPARSIPTNDFKIDGTRSTEHAVIIRVHKDHEEDDENLNPNKMDVDSDIGDEYEGKRKTARYFEAKVDVKDTNGGPLITGEYEYLLESTEGRLQADSTNNNDFCWDYLDKEQQKHEQDACRALMGPRIKFRVQWTDDPAQSKVERPQSLMPKETVPEQTEEQRCDNRQKKEKSTNMDVDTEEGPQKEIYYHFRYKHSTRAITTNSNTNCPFCQLNCRELFSLLKHLKLTHPRFLFNYMSTPEEHRVNISVSDLFDSTYVGNPYDAIRQPSGNSGNFFSSKGPVQRTPITKIIVSRPNRPPPSLAEFLEIDDNDANQYETQRPDFVSGHNRAYHYSTTNLPMSAKAVLTNDGEDITDPPWLQIKTSKMIDDFTDVNEGEKEFMKVWNRHVQHYTFVGDCQMPLALKKFIEEKGEEIVRKNLYRNFSLHLINLYEFGIIGSAHVFTAQSRMQEFIRNRSLHNDINWGGKLGEKLATALSFKEDKKPQLPKTPRTNFAGYFPNQAKK